uniref:Uncharacterized protein n=1 Tax=Anguilla anguilla TaxID=7936 RepID=A0A0E9TGV6_ANGAN
MCYNMSLFQLGNKPSLQDSHLLPWFGRLDEISPIKI